MCLACLALSALTLFSSDASAAEALRTETFREPIDGMSITLTAENDTADVSYFLNGAWSEWQTLSVENEQDPALRESNMVMFPAKTDRVRLRSAEGVTLHLIRVSDAPARYNVAALTDPDAPHVLSRRDWGADDSLLIRKEDPRSASSDTPASGDNGGTTSGRIDDCQQAQTDYPNEFNVKRRVTKDSQGRTLRWAHEYSPSVELIAVHHTAVETGNDQRSGVERIRALYQYHANNRGWGDIGYHYLVDEKGNIYEGKAGGDYVVGGHAYCNNIGTVGVALLGNFEIEKPTQSQLKALQWLLDDLARKYDIDPSRKIKFHGKTLDPIVGHRDLLSTDCPGYYVYGSMAQIRSNVANGNLYASVKLPKALAGTQKPSSKASSSRRAVTGRAPSSVTGVSRRVRRIVESEASRMLRRKLGSNAGREIENGTAIRLAARLNGTSASSRSSRRSASSRSSRVSRSSASSRISRVSSRASLPTTSQLIRIRLTRKETADATSCHDYDVAALNRLYRGKVECLTLDRKPALINTLTLDDYMAGLAEEPDTEPFEKQKAFAVAARTYAAYYTDPKNLRKFPGMPYDGSDSPATFQLYGGIAFERQNPRWLDAVRETAGMVLTKDKKIIRAPYFSSDDGRTRSPAEAGWNNFPFAEIFTSKDDPYCAGMTMRGHGVGMSGCGSEGMANNGSTYEEILDYYYPGTERIRLR